MQSIHGQEYHWKRDLFLRCNLPITPAMERQWKEEAENHWKQREYRRKEETKNKRIQRKRSRGAEQEKRKEVSVHQEFNSTEILERSLELFETEGKDGEEAEVEEAGEQEEEEEAEQEGEEAGEEGESTRSQAVPWIFKPFNQYWSPLPLMFSPLFQYQPKWKS